MRLRGTTERAIGPLRSAGGSDAIDEHEGDNYEWGRIALSNWRNPSGA